MNDPALDDVRATAPVERLLEDSWEQRSRRTTKRELRAEVAAGALFLVCAGTLALTSTDSRAAFDAGLAALLVVLYGLMSRIEFPIGAGFAVPSYLVLVPMLVLLPPATVPLLTAAGLLLGAFGQWVLRRGPADRIVFAIPDAWHCAGPGRGAGRWRGPRTGSTSRAVYITAFLAGCLLDLVSAISREAAALGIAPRVQMRVVTLVWVVDACLAPVGLLVANAARQDSAQLLLILPLSVLLILLARDRSARIAQAQHRLELLGARAAPPPGRGQPPRRRFRREPRPGGAHRHRAERRGRGAGRRWRSAGARRSATTPESSKRASHRPSLPPLTLHSRAGVRAPCGPSGSRSGSPPRRGRCGARSRSRGPDAPSATTRWQLLTGLVERARRAAADIVAHQALREQAMTDPLTQLGNRRQLAADLADHLSNPWASAPRVLLLFDLDGFKNYNDAFGHPAGDALLTRLGAKLAAAVEMHGSAYRLGGDEFCVLLEVVPEELERRGRGCGQRPHRGRRGLLDVPASCGAVLLPHEATRPDYALQLADKRMYATSAARGSGARKQTHDVLMRIMQARRRGSPSIRATSASWPCWSPSGCACRPSTSTRSCAPRSCTTSARWGSRTRSSTSRPSWTATNGTFIRQHTLLGERILNAAPALRPVANIVRCHTSAGTAAATRTG